MTLSTAALREKRIPREPGVYLMKDGHGKIIYIGKAKDLSKRVGSYFVKRDLDLKTARLVESIADVEFVVTDNETEAFLLESNLIKRYRPAFNIELKDNSRYTYLKITDEPFPRLLVARRNRGGEFQGPKGRIYGPFVRGTSRYLTVGLLRKLFKVRICNRLPKVPCLQYFIKNCDAPCIANVTREKYMEGVDALRDILDGKSSVERFARQMETEMRQASDLGDYERAKEIRDTLYRLDNLRIRQKMEKASKSPDEEYVGIVRDVKKGMAHVMALKRSRGVISDRKKFEFETLADNSFSNFLLQYYSSSPAIPHVIYASEEPDSKAVLEESLERLAGHRVRITQAESGERRRLMELVMRNIEMYVERGYAPAVVELRKALSLSSMPEVVDCFDISNLGTDIAVGSSVRFSNGKPDKDGYRKFRIKTVKGQDDFAMIGEIVRRRYLSGDMPDLVVIDGGKGQLAAAAGALAGIGLSSLPCISLAKENEEIYVQGAGEPLVLPRRSPALRMLQHARDEAHRFGLAYNRSLRKLTRP
ncbi:excinuclease ABC subunit UvrC [Nitrososphaera sp.]|uniref:excinuclease ABC subunit UvrC n=1 Tax=Nitrososphaera sp. TaxID=1971748 RepID=UPI0017A466D9|nr:excinuclease ABC subunit UvrC [Nitrososphaera sp.]NWG36801.1 excinuclease ABC subunit UvrC [Nitrososphaera sp.]